MSGASRPTYIPQRRIDFERRLARLSPETRYAVKHAMKEWIAVAQSEGYEPITEWRNALNEIDHSALLDRLLSGKPAFAAKPPLRHSYPDYDAVVQL
jgi:hypothetical protein